jgi:hypothetical protein
MTSQIPFSSPILEIPMNWYSPLSSASLSARFSRWLGVVTAAAALAFATGPVSAATTPPAGQNITLHVDTLTGELTFTGALNANISFYEISSASASLDDAHWISFQDQSILNPDGAITAADPGQIIDWMEMAHNDSVLQDMACANMMPDMNGLPVNFDSASRSYSIGKAFRLDGQHDLVFLFNIDLDYSPTYVGTVVYEPAATPEPASLAFFGIVAPALLRRRRRPPLSPLIAS